MASNEVKLEGRIVSVSIEQTKAGKDMARIVIAVERPEWMKDATLEHIPLMAFGRNVNDVRDYQPGIGVQVLGRVSGNEYQGKTYASIVGERFHAFGQTVMRPQPTQQAVSKARHHAEQADAPDDDPAF